MNGLWRLIVRIQTPIVSLQEAKRQTNCVDFDDDDAFLLSLCDLATRYLDLSGGVTRRALLTQFWEFCAPGPVCSADLVESRLRNLPASSGFHLNRAPLQAVTKVEAMQNGVYAEIPLAEFATRRLSDEGVWLRRASGLAWPQFDIDEEAWKITVRLGFGDSPAMVEPALRHAALMLIGHLYQNREAVSGFGAGLAETPMGFEALIAPYKFVDV